MLKVESGPRKGLIPHYARPGRPVTKPFDNGAAAAYDGWTEDFYKRGIPMKIETILFDMDGTLLDSLQGLMDSTNAALKKLGYPLRTREEIQAFVGNGVGKLIERALPGGLDNKDYDACLAAFKEDYKTAMYTGTRAYEGMRELVEELRQKGYRTAVVSNKIDSAVKELAERFFGDGLEAAIGDRPDARRKPAPDSVYTALDELGMPRETAVYVGDSEVDLETARNAGLPCLSVCWGNRTAEQLREHGARSISHTVEELRERILTGDAPEA